MKKMNRKKKEKKIVKLESLEQINVNVAGLDVGDEEMWVAVPAGGAAETVRAYATYTADLQELARWLQECGVESVALESTGVYWIAVFEILEASGIEVLVVNARHLKNVPGKKSDVLDCQWLQQLHSYGLLRGSFIPEAKIRQLRAYIRHRDNLIRYRSGHVQHMQKALQLMNLKLTNVLRDITGQTGMRIIKDILAGERDPRRLAQHRHSKCARSEEEIAKSLAGNYKPEYLFILEQMVSIYETYNAQIAACDAEIEAHFTVIKPQVDVEEKAIGKPRHRTKSRNAPDFDLRLAMYKTVGVDLTAIDGIDALTAQTVISEIGLDMSKWPTVKHFTSWLGLCPYNDISGGKVQKRYTKKSGNRAAQALRLSARSVSRSQSALGAYYRRMRGRKGAVQANANTAHKMARIIYFMLKNKTAYDAPDMETYEAEVKARRLKRLQREAARLGMKLEPVTN